MTDQRLNVNVLGAGPGGLYAALLLQKAHPSWAISVAERNPPGATYGWGVVFSDQTLAAFREADEHSFGEITSSFVTWDAIDIHLGGQLARCEGHRFAGLSRRRLLEILRQRCAELGVQIRYQTEIDDPATFARADLLIAADGVNSKTRAAYAEQFGPSLSEGSARFIWFGTDWVLDSFTFIFRENQHGLFTVHAYPFDGATSTFIVECGETTWRRAGLDQADEAASLAYCQALFADHLRGHRLMSNFSRWLRFTTVKNGRWSHGNIVLLGDAAHTAHFSIGSGTKLAMEDAIALAQAFEQHDTIAAALRQYELARKPKVEALQRAAADPGTHQYPSNRGRPDFRDAVAAFYERRFGVTLDPDTEVMPAIGAKECIFNLNLAFLDPGDVALAADPGYPVYTGGPLLVGAEPVLMPLLAERGFAPDLGAIEADARERARLMYLNYPNNPTGAIVPTGFFERVVEFARENDVLVVHDNAYSEITFDGYRAPSFLETPGAKDVGVEIFSLSKGWNMTGWRAGWIAGNAEIVERYRHLKTNLDSGMFEAVQAAAVAALTEVRDFPRAMSAVYE
ncbi:MAG TPA: aminotransferase class I/II-fold pyridoxal phosphate-dependent enzyme, partial [Roseiflexaceae bacterium]|nr:aminotransferase class I/II-fold pyridoxal phosphate-dependent enzyme [Roseiflexaceae bacterium]